MRPPLTRPPRALILASMNTFARLVLRHRFPILIGWLLLLALGIWSASHARLSTNLGEQFFGDKPEYLRYLSLNRAFESDEIVVVGVEGTGPLDAGVPERLERVKDRLLALQDVARVESPLDAVRLRGDGHSVGVQRYDDALRETPGDREALGDELLADPFVRGLLLSDSGADLAVAVVLTDVPGRKGEEFPVLLEAISDAFEAEDFVSDQLHLGGYVPPLTESLAQAQRNVVLIFPLVALVLLVVVWMLFGRLWPAALTLVVSLAAVVLTAGFLVAREPTMHVFFSLAPPVILVVTFSDVVHLCSAYLQELARGRAREDAIITVTAEVGRACLLTSATTFVGFMSLALVPDPSAQVMGLAMGFGVGIALLLAVTLTPILFSFLPAPRPLRRGTTGRIHRGLDALLEWARRLAWDHPRAVVLGFGALALVSVIGLPMAHMEFDLAQRFSPGNRVMEDDQWFRDRFGSGATLDLYLHARGERDLLDPEVFAAAARLQDEVVALDDVRDAVSLVTLVERIHGAMDPDTAATTPIPTSRKRLADYLLLVEGASGNPLERLIDWDRRSLRIRVRTVPGGTRAVARVGAEIHGLAAPLEALDVEVETSGLLYLFGYFFNDVFGGQARSLGLTFLVIMIMMMLGLRSLRIGAISMIPNLLPLLVLWGVVGLTMEAVDTDILLISIIAIGIGVDDTIHFLMRYRVERLGGVSDDAAVRDAFGFAGRGIVMTTVILVLGFTPCIASGYMTMRLLGTLLPLCLVVALAADLLLTPAMIRLGWMKHSGCSGSRGLCSRCAVSD